MVQNGHQLQNRDFVLRDLSPQPSEKVVSNLSKSGGTTLH
jgi:hypothetical protein